VSGPPDGSLQAVVVIGASAGGVEALVDLLGAFDRDTRMAICVVVHQRDDRESYLPEVLQRAAGLPASHPQSEEPLVHGRIYVAPPNHHLLVGPGRVYLSRGPRVNRFRPAIDPLFRSAARAYGDRVAAIVLSGTMGDGATGLLAVKRAGGVTIAQDPDEARFPEMPLAAISQGVVDYVLRVANIPARLRAFVVAAAASGSGTSASSRLGPGAKGGNVSTMEPPGRPNRLSDSGSQPNLDYSVQNATHAAPSGLTCPDCGGSLWERGEGAVVEFLCHVGHVMSLESMLAGQAEVLETGLWNAVRLLEERAALLRRLGVAPGSQALAPKADDQAAELEQQANLIRELLVGNLLGDAAS
jgi:two-component system, chemotaxis family, protein-glutamate methylesterase/glutaminase